MKKIFTSLLAGLFIFHASSSPAQAETVSSTAATSCAKIPDRIGFAGMAAAIQPASGEQIEPMIIFVGGANFPFAKEGATTAAERGAKMFHNRVGIMPAYMSCNDCGAKPQFIGKIDYPVAYAAFGASPDGLVIAGGCNQSGHLKLCTRIAFKHGRIIHEALPELPQSIAYPAFAQMDKILYVMGGQEKESSTAALKSCYSLDLSQPQKGWKKLADMPEGRILAGAAAQNGLIYLIGGCSLSPDAKGAAQRNYHKDSLVYDTIKNSWRKGSIPDMPITMAASPNPLPVIEGKIYVMGGDPGKYYRAMLAGNPPAIHPGQSDQIYCYDIAAKSWSQPAKTSIGVATAPAISAGSAAPAQILIISGETHPGIRSNRIGMTDITP